MMSKGRTALVTGGARGCGLAFARGLAEAGANIAVFDLVDPDTAFYTIEKDYNVRTAYYRVDVSSQESLEGGFTQFQKDFENALDICVPCAGINRHLPFLEFTYKDHHDLVSINVLGLYFTAQLAAKQMIANGTKHGSIILVASMASHIAVRSQLCSAYCGTKGAVRSMCPAIAKELAEYGIRVNSISPGYVRTEMTAAVGFPEDSTAVLSHADFIDSSPILRKVRSEQPGFGDSYFCRCNLVRLGIHVQILEDRPDKTSTGKADGMQPKTIETFKQMRLADPLLRNAARVYDISFWVSQYYIKPHLTVAKRSQQSTADKPLHRTGRQTHYPESLVGASDPYILLAHQGMVEEVLIDDMEARGVVVMRNSRFASCSRVAGTGQLDVVYEDLASKTVQTIRADYLVGCDGARSKVRECIPDAQLEGKVTNASWGVLDGVIDTDFPDLWSKVAVRSDLAGSILWIPRERNMTRLYVQLSETDGERVDRSKATPEYVMQRAKDAMHPFRLEWKTIEWFGNYVVGQRVAKRFMDSEARIFIAGDAGHCHSALAAQGANTSMHDSFNLAWKLNLVIRGLAQPSLLATYEAERQKIAYDLINFDAQHCKAFSQGEAALAKNFDENIRFISGVGAEYSQGLLSRGSTGRSTPLRPGTLQLPAKVTRYIDANPVDIQLDIPLLGQFRVYFFIPDVPKALGWLRTLCEGLDNATGMGKISSRADQSYAVQPHGAAPSDTFMQPQRYTSVSSAFTYAMVTQSSKSEFEIADLPTVLQESRWTLYLDDVDAPRCTEKWLGPLRGEQVGVVIVRPDGYVGDIDTWEPTAGIEAVKWIESYFAFMA
ncbi:hypothetical protein ABOM_002576 [Aspergillus bombycis]|uniref:FAD binding domain protein n=1 Tax=Aspergillus bombycis TaxID=109264 RepID=A0A1F8A715_9EURO|nr:hypothetical protein ABOM_002576 [Aspergillus bombycis]OGM47497.1 hypothetical protein ABOM_002576 [Aspergillus bombycis]